MLWLLVRFPSPDIGDCVVRASQYRPQRSYVPLERLMRCLARPRGPAYGATGLNNTIRLCGYIIIHNVDNGQTRKAKVNHQCYISFSNNIFISASPGHAQSGVQQRGGGEAAEDDGGFSAHPEVTEAGAADLESGGAPEVSQESGSRLHQ